MKGLLSFTLQTCMTFLDPKNTKVDIWKNVWVPLFHAITQAESIHLFLRTFWDIDSLRWKWCFSTDLLCDVYIFRTLRQFATLDGIIIVWKRATIRLHSVKILFFAQKKVSHAGLEKLENE